MATRNKSICLFLFLTAAMADAAPKFEPARFASSEMAPESLIEFPRSKKNVDVTIRCDTVLSVEASVDRILCYGPDRRKMSYKDAIFDVIKASVRDRFEVRTPEVVVSVKGTRFEVNLGGELAEDGVVGV